MDQYKLIQKIEEISINALPALQTQIYHFPLGIQKEQIQSILSISHMKTCKVK
ncbi:hypothetical protein ACFWDG_10680 [Peribacillus sp. NPDC060186]